MSTAFNSLPREVQDALLRGNQPEAIRLLRHAKGVSLKSAQARIESVVSQGLPSASTAPPAVPQAHQFVGPQVSVAEVATRLIALLRERAASRKNKASPEATSIEQSSSGLAPGEQPRTSLSNVITWALVAVLLALLLLE